MQKEYTSTVAANTRGGVAAVDTASISEMDSRHFLADPLIGAVEDLDDAIAILITVAAALGNPSATDTYGLQPIVDAMDIANLRIRLSRKATSDTVNKILGGGKGGAA